MQLGGTCSRGGNTLVKSKTTRQEDRDGEGRVIYVIIYTPRIELMCSHTIQADCRIQTVVFVTV